MTVNRRITLATRPSGIPSETDFAIDETTLGDPRDGELLVWISYLSLDPYMRGRMNEGKSYIAPVGIGEVMGGEVVGKVLRSRNSKFQEGDYVAGMLGWQEYAITNGKGLRKVDTGDAPISTALHVLGMTGLTAYFGLLDVCALREGDQVLVSGGAGAVGSPGPCPAMQWVAR